MQGRDSQLWAIAAFALAFALLTGLLVTLAQCDQPPAADFTPPHPSCANTPAPAADGDWLQCCSAWCIPEPTNVGTPLPTPPPISGSVEITSLPGQPIPTFEIATPTTPTATPTDTPPADWLLVDVEHDAYLDNPMFGHLDWISQVIGLPGYKKESIKILEGWASCLYANNMRTSINLVWTTTTPVYVEWVRPYVCGRYYDGPNQCATSKLRCGVTADVNGETRTLAEDSKCSERDDFFCEEELIYIDETTDRIEQEVVIKWGKPDESKGGIVARMYVPRALDAGTGIPPTLEPSPTPTSTATSTPEPTSPPATPQFPNICATVPASVPLAVEGPISGSLTIIPGECRVIVPGIEREIGVISRTLTLPGFELCYDWLVLPSTKVLGWEIPLGTVVSLVAAAFIWRLVNRQFGG